MDNFKLYKNNSKNNQHYPYLVDVQTKLLSDLSTRLVIPIIKKYGSNSKIVNLNPEIVIDNQTYIVMTQQMATVSLIIIGECIDEVDVNRTEILSAIDFLITGF